MADEFLSSLLGNPNRARLLRLFALNQSQAFTAAQAAKRGGVSLSAASREIKALAKMGLLKKAKLSIQIGGGKRVHAGKQKEDAWTFDASFTHAAALSKFIHEVSPVQHKALISALKGSGRLSTVILSGSFVGDPSRPADLVIAGDALNESRLDAAIREFEPALGSEIRYAVFTTPEFRYRLTIEDRLIRETLDYPHFVLLDKTRLL
ncbi:helix-turn-helix transcriptional regulator [Candidatus Kaiserbacteria bacterium]|nr:helix-turn-helix transcriptional regulator [Candidatus Kaiserbacteria bacterium]